MPIVTAVVAMAAAPSGVEPRFAPQTGAWVGLRWNATEIVAAPAQDVAVHADGAVLPPFAEWRLAAIRRVGPTTTVTRRAGAWEIRTTTTVSGSDVRRRAWAKWLGTSEIAIRGATLSTPVLRLSRSAADWALVPGNFPIRRTRLGDIAEGRRISEAGWTRGDYGVAVTHAPGARRSVVAAYRFLRDQARISVVGRAGGVCMEHAFDTFARLAPGEEVEIGEQVLRFVAGDEAALRDGLADLSDRLGNGPPSDQPASLARTVLYEVHPWGRLEAWGQGDRGYRYDRLTQLLPYYQRLGITALWLLPVSWPPPWVYTLPDFERIAPENGTPEQLKELVASGHRHGIRTLIDLVVYGIHPDSPEVGRMPSDVWCMDPSGKPTRVWGGTVLAADTSHPAWQRRIAEVVDHWARDYGFDGTRLDCIGWGQAHNHAAKRPSDAIAYGGLQLNKVVRDAFRRVNRDAVTLPEGGKPLVFRHADMVFDYPLYLAMRDSTWRPDLAAWVTDLREWLEWERLCYPSRARKGLVRFLECHDIVSAAEYFGVGPSQALMAACIFMQGVPLLQQEQEIGFSEDVAAWLRLRNRERCLYEGEADYLAASSSDPRLLTFLRIARDGAAVVAVNPTGAPIRASLRWPAETARAFPVAWDAFSGARIASEGGKARVTAAPYRPVVLLLRPRGAPAPGPCKVALPGARWTVRTTEGVLSDLEQDYGAKLRPGEQLIDVLPVLRRARQAEAGGLMDGASPPDATNDAVRVRVDPHFVTLMNSALRLTLARRHGGIIAALDRLSGAQRPPLILPGGDAYTDYGLFADRLYASVDGETNPRLQIEREGDTVRAVFRGVLRQRAWNGVQSCPIAGPALRYELTYAVDASPRIAVRLGLTSDVPRNEPAFAALRLPVAGLAGWSRGVASGDAAAVGTRLGAESGASAPLVLRLSGGELGVEQGSLERVFAIASGDGTAHLFMAMFDGKRPGLEAGRPAVAEAFLTVGK